MKDLSVIHNPLFDSLNALGLRSNAAAVLTQAHERHVISTGEILSVLPHQVIEKKERLNEVVGWIMQLCESLDIVILPTHSKKRMDSAVASGITIASYSRPLQESDVLGRRFVPKFPPKVAQVVEKKVEKPAPSPPKPKIDPKRISPTQLIHVVCETFRVSPHVILGTSRKGPVVQARRVAMILLHENLKRSFSQIANDLHQSDVTAEYLTAVRSIERNQWLREQIEIVKKKCSE
jgi:Bacterial dnaA protein helix-turn-helix